jgi:hypothetical protein
MALDQMLLQDTDGTLTAGAWGGVNPGSVVPYTARTENVWSSQCEEYLDGQQLGAMICKNVTVQLMEMLNLDRGAKDVKFGPWVLTPNVEEDNGFAGGVLSSVGPFYGVCPCGWDFSFYHILIKPWTTYYAEVMSLPENFMLRYWSPNPDDSVLLQFFYPDSRGVNVFVGSSPTPDMRIKLGREPTLHDEHGAHVVDSQKKRLFITLRGSPQGFSARRDLVIRRTPTVKLKMNVEITMDQFNGPQFATNLAILLGIPPERIKVVAADARRRLLEVDSKGKARRLSTTSGVALDIEVSPSDEAAAASNGGNSATSASSLDAQATELQSISQAVESAQSSDSLAAAAGGTVTVTENTAPAEAAATEEAVSDSDVSDNTQVDVTAAATASAAAEVSLTASCPTNFGVSVQVGTTVAYVYPTAALNDGNTENVGCTTVDSGYENNIVLTCSGGALSGDASACAPKSCTSSIQVTLGTTTATVAVPGGTMASGGVESVACSTVSASYSENFELTCNLGVLTAATTTCMPGCLASVNVTLTMAGQTYDHIPSSDMSNQATETVPCERVNSGYTGNIVVKCYAGALSPTYSCTARPCAAGSTAVANYPVVSPTYSQTLAIANQLTSGLTAVGQCSDINAALGLTFSFTCSLGVLGTDTGTCATNCPVGAQVNLQLGGATVQYTSTQMVVIDATVYDLNCDTLNSNYMGTFSVSCDNAGNLGGDVSECATKNCGPSTSILVEVPNGSATVSPTYEVAHTGTFQYMCEDINDKLQGLVTLTCNGGALTYTEACSLRPCETWDPVIGTVYSVTGLTYPTAQIQDGATGTGQCGNINVEYSGDVSLSCNNAEGTVTDTSQCRLTCVSPRSSQEYLIDGTNRTVTPDTRIDHGATGTSSCSSAAYGYSGTITMSCDEGVITVLSAACTPLACETDLAINVSIDGSEPGEVSPVVTIASGDTGDAECSWANSEYTGLMTLQCYASTLTVMSTADCKKSCVPSLFVRHEIGGQVRHVHPAETMVYGALGKTYCRDVAPGYSGEIQLSCTGPNGLNPTIVTSDTCVPDSCPFDANVTEFNHSDPSVAAPHGTSWSLACQRINERLYGDVIMDCWEGQTTVNTSGCAGPCAKPPAAVSSVHIGASELAPQTMWASQSMSHQDTFTTPCANIDPLFSGDIVTTCNLGQLSADESACKKACLTSMTGKVITSWGWHTVSPTTRIEHGATQTQSCTGLSPGDYSGNFVLACTDGHVNSTNMCKLSCNASQAAPVEMFGAVGYANPASPLQHTDIETQMCSDILAGSNGTATLSCSDGTVTVDTSNCMADACPTGSPATVVTTGGSHDVLTTGDLAHDAQETFTCNSKFGASYSSGSVQLICHLGQVKYEQNCKLQCQAGSVTYFVAPGKERTTSHAAIPSGDSVTQTCADSAPGYTGTMVFTCNDGTLEVTSLMCSPNSCPSTATVSLFGTSKTVDANNTDMNASTLSNAEIPSGYAWTIPCSNINDLFVGNVRMTCDAGTVYSNTSLCSGPCFNESTPDAEVGGSSSSFDVALNTHQSVTTQPCTTVNPLYDGHVMISCAFSVLTVNATGCIQACADTVSTNILTNSGSQTVTAGSRMSSGVTETRTCSSAFGANWDGSFDVTCTVGLISVPNTHTCKYVCHAGSMQITLGDNSSSTAWNTREHLASWSITCNSMNSDWLGFIDLQCSDGVVSADTSACMAPCDQGMNASTVIAGKEYTFMPVAGLKHGEVFSHRCGDRVEKWAGRVYLECMNGELGVNNSCEPGPCPYTYDFDADNIDPNVMGSASVTLEGENYTTITWSQKAHGTQWLYPCQSVNSFYAGNISMSCSMTNVSMDLSQCSDTHLSCAQGNTASVSVGNIATTIAASATILSRYSENRLCSEADAALEGDLVLSCFRNVLTADVSSCVPKCIPERTASNTLNGQTVTASIPLDLTDGNGVWQPCSNLDTTYGGSALLTCNGGVLELNVALCTVSFCSPDATVSVTLGTVTTSVSAVASLGNSAMSTFACSDVNSQYTGSGTITCINGVLETDASGCSCTEAGCANLPCSTSTTALLNIGTELITFVTPSSQISSGSTLTQNCTGQSQSTYSGTYVLTCNAGVMTADGSGCYESPCSDQSAIGDITVGGTTGSVSLPSYLAHNGSFEAMCNATNSDYQDNFAITCSKGTYYPDTSTCILKQCAETSIASSIGGYSEDVVVPGSYFSDSVPLSSGWSGTANCDLIHPNVTGTFTAQCNIGVTTVDASACVKSCMPDETVSVLLGGTTKLIAVGVRLDGSASTTMACTAFETGWLGNMIMSCSQGNLSVDTTGCEAPCKSGLTVNVVLGSTSMTLTLSQQLLSGQSLASAGTQADGSPGDCSGFSTSAITYSGQIPITCSAGAVTADISACAGTPASADIATTTVEVIQHLVQLSVPVDENADLDEVQQAFNHPASHAAFAKSIAAGIGLPENLIEILGVTLIQSRRLVARRLSSSAAVHVNYQVRADEAAAAGVDTSTLQQSMTNLGDTTSTQNQALTSSLSTNLATAATQIPADEGGSALNAVVQQIDTQGGVTVTSSSGPQTYSVVVVDNSTTSAPSAANASSNQTVTITYGRATDDDDDKTVTVVVTIAAIVLGIFSALICAVIAHKKLDSRMNQIQPVSIINQAPQGSGQGAEQQEVNLEAARQGTGMPAPPPSGGPNPGTPPLPDLQPLGLPASSADAGRVQTLD